MLGGSQAVLQVEEAVALALDAGERGGAFEAVVGAVHRVAVVAEARGDGVVEIAVGFLDAPPSLGDRVLRFDLFDLFTEEIDASFAVAQRFFGGGGEFQQQAIEAGFGVFHGAAHVARKDRRVGVDVGEQVTDIGDRQLGDAGGGGATEIADEIGDGGVGFVTDAGGDGDA